ncbi:MAG TPA: co-chaperone GroES [Candidatus Paceibacterota bacterium]
MKKNIKKTKKNKKIGLVKALKSTVGVMPLGDRVLVLPLDKNEKTSASGIIIPETIDKERPDTGTVVAVGPGKYNEDGELMPMSVKVGDKVIFSKYGPDEIKISDKEYYVISESNILAIID